MTLARISGLYEALRHDPKSVVSRAGGGDGYSTGEHLLFLAVDELRVSNWMRTKNGSKGRNRPKPISPLASTPGKRTGRTDRDPREVQQLLAKLRR